MTTSNFSDRGAPRSLPTDNDTLQAIVHAAGVSAVLFDAASGIWWLTPGLAAGLGLADDWQAWQDARWADFLHTENDPCFVRNLHAFVGGAALADCAVRMRHGNGSWRWFRCRGASWGICRLILFHDDTEARQDRAALVDSQMRLRSIYDAAPVAIVLWSREGRITEWNTMAEQVFAHGRSAVVGEKLTPLLIAPTDYDLFSKSVTHALKDNVVGRQVCRSLTAAGREIVCDWRSVALRGPKGMLVGLLSVALDITAALAAENALRKARDQAQALSQAKSEFLAVISHELRTPLNGVLGMAQLLEMLVDTASLEYVQAIRKSGENLLEIINGIVDYTDIDARPYAASLEAFAPCESLTLVAERFACKAGQKGLTFETVLDERLWQAVLGDRRSFEMVVNVLLDNAVKFTESGGIVLRLGIEFEDEQDCMVRCTIGDSGIGISADKLDGLYVPFRQGENAIHRHYGGVGLGLAMAKKLMDRMGGAISIDSTSAQGTTCVLTVSFRQVSAQSG